MVLVRRQDNREIGLEDKEEVTAHFDNLGKWEALISIGSTMLCELGILPPRGDGYSYSPQSYSVAEIGNDMSGNIVRFAIRLGSHQQELVNVGLRAGLTIQEIVSHIHGLRKWTRFKQALAILRSSLGQS